MRKKRFSLSLHDGCLVKVPFLAFFFFFSCFLWPIYVLTPVPWNRKKRRSKSPILEPDINKKDNLLGKNKNICQAYSALDQHPNAPMVCHSVEKQRRSFSVVNIWLFFSSLSWESEWSHWRPVHTRIREWERERERMCVCVCVRVCVSALLCPDILQTKKTKQGRKKRVGLNSMRCVVFKSSKWWWLHMVNSTWIHSGLVLPRKREIRGRRITQACGPFPSYPLHTLTLRAFTEGHCNHMYRDIPTIMTTSHIIRKEGSRSDQVQVQNGNAREDKKGFGTIFTCIDRWFGYVWCHQPSNQTQQTPAPKGTLFSHERHQMASPRCHRAEQAFFWFLPSVIPSSISQGFHVLNQIQLAFPWRTCQNCQTAVQGLASTWRRQIQKRPQPSNMNAKHIIFKNPRIMTKPSIQRNPRFQVTEVMDR